MENYGASAPSGLSAAAGVKGSKSVALKWKAVQKATGCRVFRGASSTRTYTLLAGPADVSYVSAGLAAETTYYYKAATANGTAVGPQSPAVGAKAL